MVNKWLLTFVMALAPVALVWFWLGFESRAPMLLALVLSAIAGIGTFLYFRIQADRRWRRALDVYVERALAQHSSHQRPKISALSRTQMRLPVVSGH
jgi:hypothetical protein